MWSVMRVRSWSAVQVPEVSQPGSWLCQTRVWPRTCMSWDWAKLTTASAPDQLYEPRLGSTDSHFISLPGVIESNWPPAIVAYVPFSLDAVTAVP
jgi:hypothetical protein